MSIKIIMSGNCDNARQRTSILPWMNHPQTVPNVRKQPNKREEGCNHLLIEMTCGQRMQKRGPVRGTARNIEFYDAFISFSGLKSTFPN